MPSILVDPNSKSQLTYTHLPMKYSTKLLPIRQHYKATQDCEEYTHVRVLLYRCSYASLSVRACKVLCGFEISRPVGNQMTINFLNVNRRPWPWCKVKTLSACFISFIQSFRFIKSGLLTIVTIQLFSFIDV